MPMILWSLLGTVGYGMFLNKRTFEAGPMDPTPRLGGYDARKLGAGAGLLAGFFLPPVLGAAGLGAVAASVLGWDVSSRIKASAEQWAAAQMAAGGGFLPGGGPDVEGANAYTMPSWARVPA